MSTDAKVSKDLMQTLEDGRKGFAEAADKLADTDRANLAPRFRDFSEQRASMYAELDLLAAAYGDDLEESGSAAAALHRGWMSVKDAITGDSYTWGREFYVRLDPALTLVHIAPIQP